MKPVDRMIRDLAPLVPVPLDAPLCEQAPERGTLLDSMVCPQPNPEQALSRKYDPSIEVAAVMKKLTPREKQVITLQAEGLTNDAIGKLLGISRERVRQVGEDVRMVAHGFPRRERSAEKYQNRGCAVCGKSLASNRDRRIFCSDRCRHKNFRDRRRAANAADVLCDLR